ncbi:hypothetical protein PVK06_007493 [Gossypium arboreum]|uniref:Uncharacterized protein n=1 Tax=Gossypium arboreum TaxID=29729 RepID=A0ABR0QHL0_GOSAR|nr:hypothetical protein PVK06_007493 [Gossypium arboreum]
MSASTELSSSLSLSSRLPSSPSRSVPLPLLNHRRQTAISRWDVADIAVSDDAGATPLRHPKLVCSEPVTTRSVWSSHQLDQQSSFTYRARLDQLLDLDLRFELPDPIYDLKSNFQVQLPIKLII